MTDTDKKLLNTQKLKPYSDDPTRDHNGLKAGVVMADGFADDQRPMLDQLRFDLITDKREQEKQNGEFRPR